MLPKRHSSIRGLFSCSTDYVMSTLRLRNLVIAICLIAAFMFIIYWMDIASSTTKYLANRAVWTSSLNNEKFYYTNVIMCDHPRPKGKETTRKVAMSVENKNRYRKVTQPSVKRVIHLATKYHEEIGSTDFYFLQPGSISFERYQCPVRDCYVTNGVNEISADAVLFHMRDTTSVELARSLVKNVSGRDLNQKWILYTMEPPWLEYLDLSRLDNVFNWTMSYRLDSDITLTYGFVGKRTDELGNYVKSNFEKKTKLSVWMVSDCCTSSKREKYVQEMRKHVNVDVFGTCGRPFCRPAESPKCYQKIANYFFYLSFENAICKDYVSEKFFNLLNQDIVPVVFGGADYEKFAPTNSFINALDFENPKQLTDYLQLVANNQSLYEQFFEWKMRGQVYLQAWTCDLCAKLHSSDFNKKTSKVGLHKWWNDKAKCKTWTLKGLVNEMYPTIPCYLDGILNQ